jgi:hypothetical protein
MPGRAGRARPATGTGLQHVFRQVDGSRGMVDDRCAADVFGAIAGDFVAEVEDRPTVTPITQATVTPCR